MSVIAVIPCYNEESAIGDIVERALKYVDKVVVADDASNDDTAEEAWHAGALVTQNVRRRGFGRTVMRGVQMALRHSDCEIVVTLDGDGQHNPDEIPHVLEPLVHGDADVVIGSRFLTKYACPRYRKFGIDVITWLYNAGHRDRITDGQSCFRAYTREVLNAVRISENHFGFSTEILVKTRRQGFRVTEVPVSCIYHDEFSRNSSMNPILQGVSVALATVKWRLWG